jgi:hypothetical protein
MIKVNFRGISNNGPKQEAIARLACSALEEALNNPSFGERVGRARYRETRFEDQNGRSFSVPPGEVYNYIASGAEMGTANDSTIDIEVDLMDMSSVGATWPGRLPFNTAYWFINGCIEDNDHISLASHFIHEWLHVSGFYHHPNNGAREDVPYIVQQIVSDILKDLALGSPASSINKSTPAIDKTDVVLAPMEYKLLETDCGAHNRSDAFVAPSTRPSNDLIM